jgi:hypothetical protein
VTQSTLPPDPGGANAARSPRRLQLDGCGHKNPSERVLVLLLLVLLTLGAFAAGYAVASTRTRRLEARLLEAAPPVSVDGEAPSEAAAARMTFTRHADEGTPEWRLAMGDLGGRMRNAGVRLVVFAHGSFVGDDPLAIARLIEDALPILPDIARKLRGMTRAHVSRLLGDLSNFPADYVQAFSQATGVDALDFTWSGENHHAARVQGAVRLARALALHGGGALQPGEGALLAGHSHGGQLFAILSQLVARTRGYEELVAAAQARGEDIGALEEHLALLRRCTIDVVTFGTPPRYGWARSAGFRLLHVVNHRGGRALAPSLRGVLHTRHGDYVHQLGAHGSDFPALTANERALNARLDALLGEGSSVRVWLRHIARGLRVSPHGHTVLVDYGDGGRTLPNFLATGLGHAAYTRRDAMLFHARLVANHFYPPPGESRAALWSERLRAWMGPHRLLPPAAQPPGGSRARFSKSR